MSAARDERREELLTQFVVDGLSPTEQAELEELMGDATAEEQRDWELTAAAVTASQSAAVEMPTDLRERLEQQGLAELRGRRASASPSGASAASSAPSTSAEILAGPASRRASSPAAWWVAAAAVIFALLSWWPRAEALSPSGSELRAQLLTAGGDVQRADWGALEDPRLAGIGGDVVWSNARQEGYMRLTGVPVNDPSVEQYQLWIVDPARDAEPIDGGVFDVNRDGEVIIPIDAKLAVLDPSVFAITLEQPGGVVVSEGPLLAAASVAG